MPNRIIKDTICTSENINMLSQFAENMFYRLIVNCDDFGRMDARPKILAARLFPLRDVRTVQIEDALRMLTSAELVTLYEVDGKPFLQMNTWNRHQRIRDSKPKYPAPISESSAKNQLAEGCGNSPQLAATRGLNPIQSESNTTPPTPSFSAPDYQDEFDADAAWIAVVSAYERNIGTLPRGRALEVLMSYCDDLTHDVVVYAIETTNLAHPDNPRQYLDKLLSAYAEKGIKTRSAAEADNMEHRQKSKKQPQQPETPPASHALPFF
jgi:hypothetical protein